MHLKNGTLLHGRTYKIVRFIKSGGFGCTYEAVHLLLNKRVAIKEFFVKDCCNRDETGRVTVGILIKASLVDRLKQKFIAEASSLSALSHEGIVNVSNLFLENGTAYYVMDYIDGCSLDEYVQQNGPLTESAALDYIGQACDALKYVHEKNILHLDVKPGNLMLDKDGKVTFIDFGTSKQYDECDGENTSTLLGNTPGYASPEQGNSKVTSFTPATDVYSLGATLYKLLTGITPPTASERSSGEELDPLPGNISRSTVDAIMKAMILNKKERLQSVGEFQAMLVSEVDGGTPPSDDVTVLMKGNGVISEPTGYHEGYGWVDLGLPSGLKWAICNVGASKPEDYGNYYSWGDTKRKNEYNTGNCTSIGKLCSDIGGDSKCDVATAKWGGRWRMPTMVECLELTRDCDWTWMTMNGHPGYKVTGQNGQSIFLPAAGFRLESEITSKGKCGYFWSSTSLEYSRRYSYYLYFDERTRFLYWYHRHIGRSVRPVLED